MASMFPASFSSEWEPNRLEWRRIFLPPRREGAKFQNLKQDKKSYDDFAANSGLCAFVPWRDKILQGC
jgi:hypothetical protein